MKVLLGLISSICLLNCYALDMSTIPNHEWDIAGPPEEVLILSSKVKPDIVELQRSNQKTSYSLYLQKNGQRTLIDGVSSFDVECGEKSLKKTIKLEGDSYKIQDDWNIVYKLELPIKCGHHNRFIFQHDSTSGQVMGIYSVVTKAFAKFKEIGRESFWNRQLDIIFPSNGDYFSYRTVHLTKGHYWDVVGHELGHAIYDMADIGAWGGGSHRIDECYSNALALSEGWASFFSAWVSVELSDPDAKFEYMVKRRAPLEIEHVPSDVCTGTGNEWRVYTFLWDIIDTHQDNETLNQKFQALWDLTFKKNFKSIKALKEHLQREGLDPILLNIVYDQNILGL